MSDFTDFYAVLDVSPNATVEEIESACSALLQAWHPSNYPPGTPPEIRELAEERTQLLIQARQELTDPERRQAFDERRHGQPKERSTATATVAPGVSVPAARAERGAPSAADGSPGELGRSGRGSDRAEAPVPARGATPGYGRLAAWLVLVGVLSAAAYAAGLVDGQLPADMFYRYSTAIAGVIFFGIVLGVVLLIARGTNKSHVFALRPPSDWRWALWAGLAILVASFGFDSLYGFAFGPVEAEQGIPSFWDGSRASPFFANFVMVAAVGPVVEELMFRGLGFRLFERFGTWTAIWVTAVLFGLLHGYVTLLPVFLVSGLMLGWLRSRTGSIYPGMLVHGVFNGVAVMLTITLT